MGYLVKVWNTYTDGSELRESFDTNSVLLHEAFDDARAEAMVYRAIRQGKYDSPLIERITLK